MKRKEALKAELVEKVRADLETAERASAATREAATHEEAKPENDKDTRALEQSYLARGQALRVVELRAALAEVESLAVRSFEGAAAALGALVVVEEREHEQTYFLAPAGGGSKLTGGVQVVTPSSPLGRALVGKREGDVCELVLAGKSRELSITRVE